MIYIYNYGNNRNTIRIIMIVIMTNMIKVKIMIEHALSNISFVSSVPGPNACWHQVERRCGVAAARHWCASRDHEDVTAAATREPGGALADFTARWRYELWNCWVGGFNYLFFLGQFFFGSEHCIGGNYVYAWNLQSLVVRQAWTIYEELDGKNDMLLSYALHVHMFMLRRT